MGVEPPPYVQIRVYESISSSPGGGAHVNVMPRLSATPVIFIGAP